MKRVLLFAVTILLGATVSAVAYDPLDLSGMCNTYHKELWQVHNEFGHGYETWFTSENQLIDAIPFKVRTQSEDVIGGGALSDVETYRVPINKRVRSICLLGSARLNHSNGVMTNPDMFSVEIVYADGTSEDDLPINLRSKQRAWYDWRSDSAHASVTFAHPLTQNCTYGTPIEGPTYLYTYVVVPSKPLPIEDIYFHDNDPNGSYAIFGITLSDSEPGVSAPPSVRLPLAEPLLEDEQPKLQVDTSQWVYGGNVVEVVDGKIHLNDTCDNQEWLYVRPSPEPSSDRGTFVRTGNAIPNQRFKVSVDYMPLEKENNGGEFNLTYDRPEGRCYWCITFDGGAGQFRVLADHNDWRQVAASSSGLPRDTWYRIEIDNEECKALISIVQGSTNQTVLKAEAPHDPGSPGVVQASTFTTLGGVGMAWYCSGGGAGQGALLDNFVVSGVKATRSFGYQSAVTRLANELKLLVDEKAPVGAASDALRAAERTSPKTACELQAVFDRLDDPELADYLIGRLQSHDWNLIDISGIANADVDTCFRMGLGVDRRPASGLDVPYMLPVVVETGVPFRLPKAGLRVAVTSYKGLECIAIPFKKKARTIYLLMTTKNEMGTITFPDHLTVQLHYADGWVEEVFPTCLATGENEIFASTSPKDRPDVYEIKCGHDSVLDKIEVLDKMSRGSIVLFGVTEGPSDAKSQMAEKTQFDVGAPKSYAIGGTFYLKSAAGSNKTLYPNTIYVNKPVSEIPPSARWDGRTAVMENAHARIALAAEIGKSLKMQSMYNKRVDMETLKYSEQPNLFLVELDGQLLGLSDFALDSVTPLTTPSESRIEFAMRTKDQLPMLRLSLTGKMDKGGEITWSMNIKNESGAKHMVQLIQLMSGLSFGTHEQEYYWTPPPSGPVGVVPMDYAASYGVPAFFALVDVFNPWRGGGMYMRSPDNQGIFKVIRLKKMQAGIKENALVNNYGFGPKHFPEPWDFTDGIGMAIYYLETPIEPGVTYTPPSFVLGFHGGDWHSVMSAYQGWLATWYKHDPIPDWFNYRFEWSSGWGGITRALVDRTKFGTDVTEPAFWWNHPASKDEPEFEYEKETGGLQAFKSAIDSAHKKGVAVIPYLEGRIFPGHFPPGKWCQTDGNLEESRMTMYNGLKPVGQCAAGSKNFRGFIASSIGRIFKETGIDGIYVDSIGSTTPWVDYDPGHSEGQYGGRWVYSVAQYLKGTREAERAVKRDSIQTSESLGGDLPSQYLDGQWSYYFGPGRDFPWAPSSNGLTKFWLKSIKNFGLCYIDDWSVNPRKQAFFYGDGFDLTRYYPADANYIPMVSQRPCTLMTPYLNVLKANGDAFTSNDRDPWIQSMADGLFVNRFRLTDKTIYTFFNARYRSLDGELLSVARKPGCHYVELVSHRPVEAVAKQGRTVIHGRIGPKDTIAIAELPSVLSTQVSGKGLRISWTKMVRDASVRIIYPNDNASVYKSIKPVGSKRGVEVAANGKKPVAIQLFSGRWLVDEICER